MAKKKSDNVTVISIGIGSMPRKQMEKKMKAKKYNKGGYANCGASMKPTQKSTTKMR